MKGSLSSFPRANSAELSPPSGSELSARTGHMRIVRLGAFIVLLTMDKIEIVSIEQ